MNIKKLKANIVYKYFEIKDIDTLFDTIVQLYGIQNDNSKLYRYNEKYYLELSTTAFLKSIKCNDNKHLKGILEEYGTLICQNAITQIGCKIKEP